MRLYLECEKLFVVLFYVSYKFKGSIEGFFLMF